MLFYIQSSWHDYSQGAAPAVEAVEAEDPVSGAWIRVDWMDECMDEWMKDHGMDEGWMNYQMNSF